MDGLEFKEWRSGFEDYTHNLGYAHPSKNKSLCYEYFKIGLTHKEALTKFLNVD